MAVRLSTIAKGKGPLSDSEIKQTERWVQEDWEAADHDRDAVKLIKRLLETVALCRSTIDATCLGDDPIK